MDVWVGYAQLIATTLLAFIVAYYGRKYGKSFEASKKAEIDAKDAWISNLEGELRLLREMNPESLRKHTIALKEHLQERIEFLENAIVRKEDELNVAQREKYEKQAQIFELQEMKERLALDLKISHFFDAYNQQLYKEFLENELPNETTK